MEERAASLMIRRAAALGDRARRTAAVARGVTRLAAPVAAAACLATVLAVVLRGPRSIGPLLLGLGLVTLALAFADARRRRTIADLVAADLDRAAGLGGAFRSAYWFVVAASSRPAVSDDPWLQFHIADTATRVERLDWTTIYARPIARRAWAIAGVLVITTLIVSRWPARDRRIPAPAETVAAAASEPGPTAPQVSLPKLVESMRAMKSGQVLSNESLAVIGQALEIAKHDSAAKNQFDNLFKETVGGRDPESGSSGAAEGEDSSDGGDERTRALANPWALDWAYRDAVARSSANHPSEGDRQSGPSRRGQNPQPGADDRNGPTTGSGSKEGAGVQAEVRGEAAGFSSLLFGRQQSAGEPGQTFASGAAAPRSAALTAALRQEVVRASTDIADVTSVPSGARRATSNASTSTANRLSAGIDYDRGRGSQPPAVPERRRGLVHDFFLRQSEAGPSSERR